MNQNGKTWSDVVSEMRNGTSDRRVWSVYDTKIRDWADQFEAAAKRLEEKVESENKWANHYFEKWQKALKVAEAAEDLERFMARHQPDGFLWDASEPKKGPDELWKEFCDIDLRLETALLDMGKLGELTDKEDKDENGAGSTCHHD